MAAVYKEQLGEEIRRRRKALGLTQRALADKAHVKETTTVSRWERGEREPTDLEAVAKALDTTASEMLSGLHPLHQKDRLRLDPAAPTQLDRLEAMLRLLLSRLPDPAEEIERELQAAIQQARKRAADNARSARNARRLGKAR